MESAESPYLTRQREVPGGPTAWLRRNETRLVTALGIILAVRLWISPLPSSFWMDETGTVWAIAGSFKDVISRLNPNFPQMPLFVLVTWAWSRVAAMSEVALRLPSVIEMSVAALMLWLAARKLSNNVTAAYTLLALASLSHVSYAAADARPYALAILCTAWAFFESVQWSQTRRKRHLVLQGIAFGLAMSSHYLFGVVIAPNALCILADPRKRWMQAMPALLIPPVISFLVLAPSIPLLLNASRNPQSHAFALLPSWTDLGVALIPPRWIIATAAGIALGLMFARPEVATHAKIDTRSVGSLAVWAAAPACILFACSLVSGLPVMTPRYLLSQTPGLVVLGAYLIGRLQMEQRLAVAAVLFAICLAAGGRTLWTQHASDDWRMASSAINQLRKQNPSTPVLIASPFVESKYVPLPASAQQEEYLLAPLEAYPVEGPVSMLPVEMTPDNSAYVHSLFETTARSNCFIVLIPAASHLTEWVYGRFDSEFTITRLQPDPIVLSVQRRVAR